MSREEQAASALAGLKEELQQDPPQEGEEMKHEQAGAVSEGGSGKEDDIATETAASGSRSGALATDTAAVQQAAARAKRKYRKRKKEPVHRYPVPPRIVKVVNKPRTFVNHSYNDFSCVPPEPDYQPTWEIEKMTFAQKIHHMLSDERNAHCLVWMPHGRAFKILVPKFLETEVLPRYLGHSKYSRFLTQLRTHGFKHLTTGIDQSCYYHECFLRDRPHLCKYMPIHELDPRRKNADPENEPDFYAISKMYPLETIPQPRVAPVVQEMTGAPGMVGGFNPSGSGTGQQIQPFFPQHDPFQPYPFTPHMGDMPSTPHHQPSVANVPNIPQHQPSHGQMPAAPQHQQPSLLPYPPPDTAHFPMQNMPMMMPPLPGAQANIPNEPYHPQQWTEQEEVARLPSLDRFRPMDTVLGTSWQQHQQQAQQQQQQQQHPLPPPEYYNKPPDPMQFSHMAHYPPMAAAKELPHPFEHPGPTRAVAHSLLERNISDQATSSEESDSKVSPTFVKRNDHSFS